MQCDICKKDEATVHLTEIIDNKMTKLHLCEECARKKGAEMEEHFGLSDLLAGLADFGTKASASKECKLKCPKCGMNYTDFKKTGRLGCANCYSAFEENLMPLIKRIHGALKHCGKEIPSRPRAVKAARSTVSKSRKEGGLEELKVRLHRAIKLEEFEEAAILRDKIRRLEKGKGSL